MREDINNKYWDKTYEPLIIIADGISFYGLSDLILLKGLVNDFSYAQL